MPASPEKLTNVHPADELFALREEIARLTRQADKLRDQLLADGADLHGDQYTAVIYAGMRETVDRVALTEAFGEKAIAPFLKRTNYQTVKLQRN
jgi:hypothetical protein